MAIYEVPSPPSLLQVKQAQLPQPLLVNIFLAELPLGSRSTACYSSRLVILAQCQEFAFIFVGLRYLSVELFFQL